MRRAALAFALLLAGGPAAAAPVVSPAAVAAPAPAGSFLPSRHVAPVPAGGDWRPARFSDGPAFPTSGGAAGVRWGRETIPGIRARAGFPWEFTRGETAFVDSLVYWREQSQRPLLQVSAVAQRRLAAMLLADGDARGADSVLGSWRLAHSVWAWPGVRDRAALALARGDARRADSLLEHADRKDWPDAEQAEWLALRARLAAARGDTARAREGARQVVRVYPALAAAGRALALLDSIATARHDTLDTAEALAAVEVDVFRGARESALARLRAALARAGAGQRGRLAQRMAELQRQGRHPAAARAAADTALAFAADAAAQVRARLEQARAFRDAGLTDSALAVYARVARTAESAPRALAWWESAREAQDRGRWPEALEAFQRLAGSDDARADDARFQCGLVRFIQGDADSARAWWRRSSSEASRFWLGVSLRRSDRAASDSLLNVIAREPGYGFYRAAARDTLGLRGWKGALTPEQCQADSLCQPLQESRLLQALGLEDDANVLLARWIASDPRLVPPPAKPDPMELLMGVRVSYALGAASAGTRLAERAARDVEAQSDTVAWGEVPWAYPPAFEPLVVAAESLGVERALLWALMRQESRFDPRARSRSDALGLTQLKSAAAGDMARQLHDPAPSESTLFTPAASIRYGARYLAQWIRRFDGRVPVALAAYNAGPSAVRKDWRELLARGGEALYCELASNADSQDYVKRIVGMRQAYRELRPASSP